MDHARTFRTLTFYLAAAAAFFLDQLTKLAIVGAIAFGHSRPLIDGFLYLSHALNDGAAWSLFAGQVPVLAAISLGVSLALVAYQHATRPAHPLVVVGLGLLLGGALGNGIDRALVGQVRDMIDLRWYGAHVFPIFNVADVCINAGVAMLGLHALRHGSGDDGYEKGDRAEV